MTTAVPEASMVAAMITTLSAWFATPAAAEASSDTRLSIKVLIVPITRYLRVPVR